MRVLTAPDKFRDALDAVAAAEALTAGVRDVLPQARIDRCPLADGGEGTGAILAGALGAQRRTADVLDPLGRVCRAFWWLIPDRRQAVIEMAEASGLKRLRAQERDPLRTTTYGTGQLIRAALEAGCRHVSICVGGSATVDGGAGCLQALGFRMLDSRGREIREPLGGGRLHEVARLQPPADEVAGEFVVLCDVENPLTGLHGAAPVYGPQKGAADAAVAELSRNLEHWARVLADFCGRDVAGIPRGGAAGGLPIGLHAALGAILTGGFEQVARHVGLERRIAAADIVLTGEGRLDEQTSSGKVIAGLSRMAAALNRPVIAFVGAVADGSRQNRRRIAARLGLSEIRVITPEGTPLEEALHSAGENLRRGVAEYLRSERRP